MAPSKLIAVLLALAALMSMAAAQPPPPPPPTTPPANGTCNPVELRVCSPLLSGLLGGILPGGGGADDAQCCSLLGVLPGVDAAVCLCNALRDTNILGSITPNLNVPLALRLVLGRCGPGVPAGFTCP